MKKRFLLLISVIIITFIGGFSSGVFYPVNIHSKIKESPKLAVRLFLRGEPLVPKTQSKVLIGYVQDFRDPNTIDYSKYTHVIFSFVHPTVDGDVLFSDDYALTNLRTIVAKAKKYHTKVILSIGGWSHIQGGESYPYFKAAISNSASRTKLVSKLVSIVDKENLNGIDIDFEHPRSADDAKNLAAFTKQLSQQLHAKNDEISIAVYSKINAATLTEVGFVQYEPTMFGDMDHVNIMAYDGQWDGKYNAANLSPYQFAEKSVNYWAHLFDQYKLSKSKLVLGVPFYAQPENPNVKQVSFATIQKTNPAAISGDTINMNGTTYYFNGTRTMEKKTQLALDHGFGGMMAWEAGLDAQGPTSLTAVIYNELKKLSVKYYAVKE